MESADSQAEPILATANRLLRGLVEFGGNRLELLLMEVREERVRCLHAVLLTIGVTVFGLLFGMVLTGAIVVLFWDRSPMATLLALAGLYGTMAAALYRRLEGLLRDWQHLPATLEQLRKDRACLEDHLAQARTKPANAS
jgi:uncharacterized membrane protein YqjE